MEKYVLENEFLKVIILSTGSTLYSVVRKTDNLNLIVTLEDDKYINNNEAHGAIVGPAAGRIMAREIWLNKKKYVIKNFNKTLLHSGEYRISNQEWKLLAKDDTFVEQQFSYENDDYLFMSNQTVNVKYMLDGKKIICSIKSESDEEKIMNYTNHTYWTLGSSSSNTLFIKGDIFDEIETTKDSLLTGNIVPIEKTKFNFKEYSIYKNIDNVFTLDGSVSIKNDVKNIKLKVSSNSNAVVIYNDCFSSGKRYKGIAIEMQGYPSAITFPNFPKNIYKFRENIIEYELEW